MTLRLLLASWLLLTSGCAAWHAAHLDEEDLHLSADGSSRGFGSSAASLLRCDSEDAMDALLPGAIEEAEDEARGEVKRAYRAMVVAVLDDWIRPPGSSHLLATSESFVSRAPADALRILHNAMISQHSGLCGFALMSADLIADARLFAAALDVFERGLADVRLPLSNAGWHELHDRLSPLRALAVVNGVYVRRPGVKAKEGDPKADYLQSPWAEFLGLIVPHEEEGAAAAVEKLRELAPGLRAWLEGRDDLPPQVLWKSQG